MTFAPCLFEKAIGLVAIEETFFEKVSNLVRKVTKLFPEYSILVFFRGLY